MRALLFSLFGLGIASSFAAAQVADQSPEGAVCVGLAFGPWNPPLDWTLAGHGEPVDSARVPRAPGGRGWAMSENGTDADSTLVLFPVWWPAGVVITVERKPRSPIDTARGRALALVGDGTKKPPVSAIRAWQKPCVASAK